MLELNATFIGEIIVFLVLVWFLAKYVVPPLSRANSERQKIIADGLAAADRGQKELEAAATRSEQLMREARERARTVEEQAARRANEVLADKPAVILGSGLVAMCAAMAPLMQNGPVDYCLSPAYHPPAGSFVFSSSGNAWKRREAANAASTTASSTP